MDRILICVYVNVYIYIYMLPFHREKLSFKKYVNVKPKYEKLLRNRIFGIKTRHFSSNNDFINSSKSV